MSGYLWRGDPGLLALNQEIMAQRRPGQPQYERNEAPHGTASAYRRHHRNGEAPCEPCKAAEIVRMAEYRARRRVA